MRNRVFGCLVLGTGVLLLAASPLLADTAGGMAAFRAGDYQRAFTQWSEAANRGDAEAQYDLGVLYAKGLGVSRDMSEAMRWYRTAAERGNMQAQFRLGQVYAKGWGVPRDEADAMRWMEP